MSYLVKMLAVMAALLVMAGCGVSYQQAKPVNLAEYPYRHAAFDYKYAWSTLNTDQGVVIEGVMKNVRYAFIESIEIKVEMQGKDGKTIARASDFPMPQQTREGDVSHFGLLLKDTRPAAGDIFQFTVHYRGNEGDTSRVNWISMFRVDALTGAVIRPQGGTLDKW
jgi:hypothetical protein